MRHIFASSLKGQLSVLFIFLIGIASAHGQYTDRAALADLGGPQEFARRRAELLKQVKEGYVVLFAKTELPEADHYREDNDFYYFTGIEDPGAVLVMDASNGKSTIAEPEQPARTKQVYGPNLLSMSAEEREKLFTGGVVSVALLDRFLANNLAHETDLWLRLSFPDKADEARPEVGGNYGEEYAHPYGQRLPGDRGIFQKLAERYPAAHQRDVTPFIDATRNIKTPQEIAVLRRNGKLSAEGVRRAIVKAHPGTYEYEIEAEADYWFRKNGAQGWAYPAIVGSGNNINTWHYFSDREQIPANGLVVFDFAASLDHMTMDITRTFNVSGKFTAEQAKWYAVDLQAQKACIALLRPGHTYEEASNAAKAVYEKAGIANHWPASWGFPGHFVGLATHDVLVPKGPIKPGQVVTVEPIVEFPDQHLHFRVEDTVLITNGEPEILSAAVPKEMDEIEKLPGSEK